MCSENKTTKKVPTALPRNRQACGACQSREASILSALQERNAQPSHQAARPDAPRCPALSRKSSKYRSCRVCSHPSLEQAPTARDCGR